MSKINPNQIYNADCLEILNQTEDKSVDLVFTDPPYNVKKKYDGYDDNRDPHDYKNWMSKVVSECIRVSKNGICIYVGSKLTALFFDILPENVHFIPVHKRAAGVFSGNYMLQYHSLFSTAKPVIKCKDLWDDVRLPGEGYFFREKRYDSPGMTSELMIEKVLHHFTEEGDIVLDPFMGCGATAEACIKTNRKYIGIEQSKKYCDIANERIECLKSK